MREELERFFEAVDEIAEGQLEQLEEQVVTTSQQLGRTLLEGVLDSRLRHQRPAARRQGSCGHRQRLVGERPKELLTLVGKVRFVRPYYQCLEVDEQEGTCTHGEAPDDVLWGVHQQRTTGGVQREISYLCGRLTFEEAADTFCRQVPLGMSGRQALNADRARWEKRWRPTKTSRSTPCGPRPASRAPRPRSAPASHGTWGGSLSKWTG